jgi:NTP pyrophosphatase (non-canonical NTP hydrolase)
LELAQLLEVQKSFDRQTGWNEYERCDTSEKITAFMEHLTLKMIDELGGISRVRKRFRRDGQPLDVATLKKEMVDMFIFVMQGSMALKMNLEDEYRQRMRQNEKRFLKKSMAVRR